MNYVAFLAVMVLLQFVVLTAVLQVIRRWTMPGAPKPWYWLMGQILLLTVVSNGLLLLPGMLAFLSGVFWLVGLRRLSGLDMLSNYILSFSIGVVFMIAIIMAAQYFEVSLGGHDFGAS